MSDQTLLLLAQLQQRVLAQEERIRSLEDRMRVLDQKVSQPSPPATLVEHREQERLRILAALEATNWNKFEAADRIGMARRTLYRKLKEYGIQERDMRSGVAKREKQKAKGRAHAT